MKRLLTYKMFEAETSELVLNPAISDTLEKLGIRMDAATLAGIQPILDLAEEITMEGRADLSAFSMTLSNRGESVTTKLMRNQKFPGRPKFVTSAYFEKLPGKIFYRGTSKKWAEEMKTGDFTGANNLFTGTWITDDREYASNFGSVDKVILEIKLDPKMKVVGEIQISNIRSAIAHEMTEMFIYNYDKYATGEEDQKRIKYQALYIKDYFNNTMIAMSMGYDAVKFDEKKLVGNRDVYVVFNQEKLNIREL